jgi:hypothetical protein
MRQDCDVRLSKIHAILNRMRVSVPLKLIRPLELTYKHTAAKGYRYHRPDHNPYVVELDHFD